jgi:HEPN domain-containing protein
MKLYAQRWLNKSRGDCFTVETFLQSEDEKLSEHICFYAQQSIKRLIRSLLAQRNIHPSEKHGLRDLFITLRRHYHKDIDFNNDELHADIKELSPWTLDVLYPGMSASWEQAVSAAASCSRLKTFFSSFIQPSIMEVS